MDGTVIETVKRVAELSWTPKADGKHLSAYRLHTHFEVLSGKAVRIDATSANPKGDADEPGSFERGRRGVTPAVEPAYVTSEAMDGAAQAHPSE